MRTRMGAADAPGEQASAILLGSPDSPCSNSGSLSSNFTNSQPVFDQGPFDEFSSQIKQSLYGESIDLISYLRILSFRLQLTFSLPRFRLRLLPEHYGQCHATLGYRTQGYEILNKYCAERGKSLDPNRFRQARAQKLTELCSQPHEVFTLAFRTVAGLNGPEQCPEVFLTSETLRKAQVDGCAAGYALKTANENSIQGDSAERRRFDADRNGFWFGLEDRLMKTSSDTHREASESYGNKSRILRDLYPKASESKLTSRLKCTSDGFF